MQKGRVFSTLDSISDIFYRQVALVLSVMYPSFLLAVLDLQMVFDTTLVGLTIFLFETRF